METEKLELEDFIPSYPYLEDNEDPSKYNPYKDKYELLILINKNFLKIY